MLHVKTTKRSVGISYRTRLQFCHHAGIQSWRSGNVLFLDLRRTDGRNVKLRKEFNDVRQSIYWMIISFWVESRQQRDKI